MSACASEMDAAASIIAGRIRRSSNGRVLPERKYGTSAVDPQVAVASGLQYLDSSPSAMAVVTDMHSIRYGWVQVTAYACTPAGVAASICSFTGANSARVTFD